MKIFSEDNLTVAERRQLLCRPSQSQQDTENVVQALCMDVKQRGDEALRHYTERFDKVSIDLFRVSSEEMSSASKFVSSDFMKALEVASSNIRSFHNSQVLSSRRISTMDGVECWRESRPIENVGLYIPAGSAPLPSTVLMLGIPAKLAGCSKIALCSPPVVNGSVDPYVLAAAAHVGISEVYKIGGAQAIAAMAYGTFSIPKVDKIFGPGNRYVTAAKKIVSADPDGAAIDLLAGPSEVLILADESARPEVIAYDLISQAEHDPDAHTVLVTPNPSLAQKVLDLLPKCVAEFPRNSIVEQAMQTSFVFLAKTKESAIEFSNAYAPEHLIINMMDAESIIPSIKNAGSVFVGAYSPVTAGDYASGTNHTLPTNGTAKATSGVSLESFQKNISFQQLSKDGLKKLAPTLETFSATERLQAHGRAVTSRLEQK